MTKEKITEVLDRDDIAGYEYLGFNAQDVWKVQYQEEGWLRPWPVMAVHTGSAESEEQSVIYIMAVCAQSDQRPSADDLEAYLGDNEQNGNWGSYALHKDEEGKYSVIYTIKYRQKDLTEESLLGAIGWIANYCQTFHSNE